MSESRFHYLCLEDQAYCVGTPTFTKEKRSDETIIVYKWIVMNVIQKKGHRTQCQHLKNNSNNLVYFGKLIQFHFQLSSYLVPGPTWKEELNNKIGLPQAWTNFETLNATMKKKSKLKETTYLLATLNNKEVLKNKLSYCCR